MSRCAARRCSFLAAAIENADEERSDAWYLRDTGKGLRLMTGRLLACEVARSKMRVSVIGPVTDEVRAALGSDPEADEEFKIVPGALLLTFPVEHALEGARALERRIQQLRRPGDGTRPKAGQPRRSCPRGGHLRRERRGSRVAAARSRC